MATGEAAPQVGWQGDLLGSPTSLVLLRHGVTASTVRKVFSGSGGSDPELTDEGRRQAERAAEWLARLGGVDAVVTSPLRRTQETAGVVARRLGLDVALEPGLRETAFGDWEGHSFAQIQQQWPSELDAWLASTAVAPPGGESFDAVDQRVQETLARLLDAHAGRTVVAVSHVTPIKILACLALDAPLRSIYRMELAPASITQLQWWPDGTPSLRSFSLVP